MTRDGGCQCGAVRYTIEGEAIALAVCHCKECQRQSGSAFGMSLLVPKESFRLLSGELKEFVRSSDSGRSLRCTFCGDCGTRIYHDPNYLPGVFNVRAGTLDDTSELEPQLHAWTSSKQKWFEIPDGAAECFERQP